jgi:tungstate transport system substrate-binding protein
MTDKETAMGTQSEGDGNRDSPQLSRRDVVKTGGLLAAGAAAAAAVAACTSSSSRSASAPAGTATTSAAAATTTTIRLASVSTIQDGGLLPQLLAPFEMQTGRRVQVYIGEDVYVKARAGEADLVFSHFGHKDAQAFVAEGLGQWPRMVLFNSIALIMPTTDPASIAGLSDPLEAFGRIAAARAPFIVNAIPELVYLADILWNATGRPDRSGWYRDTGLQQDAAMRATAAQRGYSLWGVTPFLVWRQKNHLPLQPVLYSEEIFHRIMGSVVVNPAKFPRANVAGSLALQEYFLTAATQALIRNFRYPGLDEPLFWPAGRNNAPNLLSLPTGTSPGQGPGTGKGAGTGEGAGTGTGG